MADCMGSILEGTARSASAGLLFVRFEKRSETLHIIMLTRTRYSKNRPVSIGFAPETAGLF